MSTPHNAAAIGEIAKTVLMPGDPLRSQFVAENFLTDARLVNNVRGIQGYTGTYKGREITVMASGMGMPSMGIYSHELYNDYDVDNIIRIGSAGAIVPHLQLLDVVAGVASSTNGEYAQSLVKTRGHLAPAASFELLKAADEAARELGIALHFGSLFSSDHFYIDNEIDLEWGRVGCLAVEMESAALYANAMIADKRALTICTISDHLIHGTMVTNEQRQTSFAPMMQIALEAALKL